MIISINVNAAIKNRILFLSIFSLLNYEFYIIQIYIILYHFKFSLGKQ